MTYGELWYFLHTCDYRTNGDDVQWNIFHYQDHLLVAFQESRSKKDWLVNFNFPVRPYKHQENTMYVARGWCNAWKSCNDDVMAEVIEETERYPNLPIWFAGYSYGSAMALLAAEDYHYRTGDRAERIITYGSVKPLFGRRTRKHFAECAAHVHQFCHVNDIVTKCVPLPFYCRIKTDSIGKDERNFWGLFNPQLWHTVYGNDKYYTEDVNGLGKNL